MNNKILGTALVLVIVIAVAAVAIYASGTDETGDHPETPDTPDIPATTPLDRDISELPLGSELIFETTGSYTNAYGSYELSGEETYTVISKTSSLITFEVNGTVYAKLNGQQIIFSQSNGDVKTWDLTDDHEPSEKGVLSTEFGIVDVKIVDWVLPENAGGFKITNLGSTQFWTDTGYGVKQSMNYSIDSTGEVTMVTKTLTSIVESD